MALAIAAALGAALLGGLLLRCAQQTVQQQGAAPRRGWGVRCVLAYIAVCQVAVALALTLYYGVVWQDLLRTLLALAILWPCAWADAQVRLIPNRVLLPGTVLCAALLAVEILLQPQQALYFAVRALLAGAALLLTALLCRALSPQAVGMGDVKLLGVLGFCLGMDLVWPALFFGFLLLFVVCVFLLLTHRVSRSDSVPFAPFLLAGTVLAAFLTGI